MDIHQKKTSQVNLVFHFNENNETNDKDILNGKTPLRKHLSQKIISSTSLNKYNFSNDSTFPKSNLKKPIYIPQSHAFKSPIVSYSYFLSQNSNFQHHMEDMILISSPFNSKDNKHHLFGVFDGHGGTLSAQISRNKFPKIFSRCLKENQINIEECLSKAFFFVDHETFIKQCHYVGNTATIIYIANKMVYCANVGDSKCFLVFSDKVIQMTTMDRPSNGNERRRVEGVGGEFRDDRLNGELCLTRAIGDHELKDKGLIGIPHINKCLITPDVKFCVIGSDGVWDYLSNIELLGIIRKCKGDEKRIGKSLVDKAKENGSKDNLSCIVIKFDSG